MEAWENRLKYNLDTMAQKHDDWDKISQKAYKPQPRRDNIALRLTAICASLVMLTAIGFFAYGYMQSPADVDPGTDPDANPVVTETDVPSEASADDPSDNPVIPSIEPYDPWNGDKIVTLDLESGIYADVTPDKMEEDTGLQLMKNRDTGETYVVLPGTGKAYKPIFDMGDRIGEWGIVDALYDDEIGILIMTVWTKEHGSAIIAHRLSDIYYSKDYVAAEPLCLVKKAKGEWAVYGADVTVGADVSELTVVKTDTYYGCFSCTIDGLNSSWGYAPPQEDKNAWLPVDKEKITTRPPGEEITWYRCDTSITEWPAIEMKLKINDSEVVTDETKIVDYLDKVFPFAPSVSADELSYIVVNATITNPNDYALQTTINASFLHNAEGEYIGHLRSFDKNQNEWQPDNSDYWHYTFEANEVLEVQFLYLVETDALEEDMFIFVPHTVDAGTAYMDGGPYDFLQIN